MIKFFKEYFWMIVLGIGIVFVAVLFRDMDKVEELKSLLRRKRVEDEVAELKKKAEDSNNKLEQNEELLVALAEDLKKKKVDVSNASNEELDVFWDDFFKRE